MLTILARKNATETTSNFPNRLRRNFWHGYRLHNICYKLPLLHAVIRKHTHDRLVFYSWLVLVLFPGGEAGARGLNLLIRTDGRTINLGPKTAVAVQPGVSFFHCYQIYFSVLVSLNCFKISFLIRYFMLTISFSFKNYKFTFTRVLKD